MWLVKPLVVIGALYVVWEFLIPSANASSLSSTLTCDIDQFIGTWNGQPTCLHQGGVGYAGGDGSDGSSPVSNDPIDGGGPITSPLQPGGGG